jgi:hypothetical protein
LDSKPLRYSISGGRRDAELSKEGSAASMFDRECEDLMARLKAKFPAVAAH